MEVDESLFQEMEDLDLEEDDPSFAPLEIGSDEDWMQDLNGLSEPMMLPTMVFLTSFYELLQTAMVSILCPKH